MADDRVAANLRDVVYLAAPLFNEVERQFNRQIRDLLIREVDVYLPQEDGLLLADEVKNGTPPHVASKLIFQVDVAAIRRSTCLLVVLDGRTVDEGAAFELGMGYALGKPCYGLQTDVRRLLAYGNNPMIQHSLLRIFSSLDELAYWVGQPDRTKQAEGQHGEPSCAIESAQVARPSFL